MGHVIDLGTAFASFEELWAPKAVTAMNDYLVKVAKVRGEFVWHVHEDTDEFFLVIEGEMTIDLDGDESVVLGPLDAFTVPAGMRHRPRSRDGASILLIEPATVVNTGEITDSYLTRAAEWIDGSR